MRPSAQHHQEASLPALTVKRREMTKNVDVQVKRVTEATLGHIMDEFEEGRIIDTDLDLIRDDERFVDFKFAQYSRRKLLATKLTKHIRSHKAMDNFVSSVVPPKINLCMHYGDGWNGKTSYKG